MADRINCTSCGGEVPLNSKASKTAVCPYCASTLIVNQAAIEAQGKFALLADTPSCLAVGWPAMLGDHKVHVLGRIQYRHDAGYWDEWWVYVPHKDAYVWISQDEGEYMLESPLTKQIDPPNYDSVSPGDVVTIGKHKLFVEEKNTAEMVGMQGELPLDAAPGRTMRYLDLTDNKVKATIEYFEDGSSQTFRGRYLKPRDLRAVTDAPIDLDLAPEARPGPPQLPHPEKKAPQGLGVTRSSEGLKPQNVSCPNCGGSVTLRDPQGSVMAVCEHCGGALDVSVAGNVELLYLSGEGTVLMPLEVGMKGTLRGVEWTVLGRLLYEQRDEGVWKWRTAQLFNPQHGYAFLEVENGHWMFFTPLRNQVKFDPRYARAGQSFSFLGQRYKVYERSDCKIKRVEGELTWVARQDDKVRFMDATNPPNMLSAEWTDNELEWEMGVYMTPKQVADAFGIPASKMPRVSGVAPAQPFERSSSRIICTVSGFLAAMILLTLGFMAFTNKGEAALPQQTITSDAYLSDDGYTSPPFEIPDGNHICKLSVSGSGMHNNWVAFSIALIDAEDETVLLDADTVVERYYGTSGGESWSEGNEKDYALFRLEGPRTYRVAVFGQAGEWSQLGGDRTASTGPPVYLSLDRGVTPVRYYLVALILALLFPAVEIGREIMHRSQQSPDDD